MKCCDFIFLYTNYKCNIWILHHFATLSKLSIFHVQYFRSKKLITLLYKGPNNQSVNRNSRWILHLKIHLKIKSGRLKAKPRYIHHKLGANSSFYPKNHMLKFSIFPKFTMSKSHFSQNSHFQNFVFHKVHVFIISLLTKFTFLKCHFSQNPHF